MWYVLRFIWKFIFFCLMIWVYWFVKFCKGLLDVVLWFMLLMIGLVLDVKILINCDLFWWWLGCSIVFLICGFGVVWCVVIVSCVWWIGRWFLLVGLILMMIWFLIVIILLCCWYCVGILLWVCLDCWCRIFIVKCRCNGCVWGVWNWRCVGVILSVCVMVIWVLCMIRFRLCWWCVIIFVIGVLFSVFICRCWGVCGRWFFLLIFILCWVVRCVVCWKKLLCVGWRWFCCWVWDSLWCRMWLCIFFILSFCGWVCVLLNIFILNCMLRWLWWMINGLLWDWVIMMDCCCLLIRRLMWWCRIWFLLFICVRRLKLVWLGVGWCICWIFCMCFGISVWCMVWFFFCIVW